MGMKFRPVLPCSLAFAFASLFIGTCAAAEEPITYHAKVEPLAFKAPGRALMLRDGTFAAASKGKYFVSKDEGKTWQPQGDITSGQGPKIEGGMLIEDHNGALVLVYRDDAGMKLERTPENVPLPGASLDVWCARSTDGGKTWTDHQVLIDGFCGAFIGALCMRDNKLVIPLQDLRYHPPRHVTVVFVSADGGKTWHKSADLDIGGNGAEDGGFESIVAERTDGTLLMILRTTRDRLWRSESADRGLTWALPVPTDIKASNSPAYLLALKSGKLAMVWNPLFAEGAKNGPRRVKPRYAERPDSVYREEMLFALSGDGGETWTKPQILAKQKGGKLRYAYMFERSPGEIWVGLKGQFLRIREGDFASEQ
jgi:sialidase-1